MSFTTTSSASFRNTHLEILKKLNSQQLSSVPNVEQTLNFIDNRSILPSSTVSNTLPEIQQKYSKNALSSSLEKILFEDMKHLLTHHENNISKLNEILMHEKIAQNEYTKLINSIKDNEGIINEMLSFYNEYLKDNKGFLIRNEILKTFLSKITISKEEKDNLKNQDTFNESFFNIIHKMNIMKHNIEIIQQNSSNFSKNLLMSLKEHFNLFDEMINEKSVLYLKQLFHVKRNFNKDEFQKVIVLLQYLTNKSQYITFVLNEYTQMRKKNLEEFLKAKYLSMNTKKYDEIFKNLNQDFILHFMREYILVNVLFDDTSLTSITNETLINLLNNEHTDNIETIMKDLTTQRQNKNKDNAIYIMNINTILFVFEDLFVQYTQKVSSYSEVYKITLLSYFFTEQVENIFKENGLNNISLKLSLIIANYKKTFTSLFKKFQNDLLKTLKQIKNSDLNYLIDNQVLSTSENEMNSTIKNILLEYVTIFKLYEEYKIVNDDKEIANPKEHEVYICLTSLFHNDKVKNENSLEILFKIINLLFIINDTLHDYDSTNAEKNMTLSNELIDKAIIIVCNEAANESDIKTNFEEGHLNHDKSIALIERMIEKIQVKLFPLNTIKNYALKEEIKTKLKDKFIELYINEFINKGDVTEDEVKNYLDII